MATDSICKYLAEQYPQSFAAWVLQWAPLSIELLGTELSVEPIQASSITLLHSQDQALFPDEQAPQTAMTTDNICKYLAEQNPSSFAGWLLEEAPSSADVLKTELSVEPIRADFVALLHPQDQILHLEFQVKAITDPPMPFRMLEYFVRLYRQYGYPIEQVLIFLKPTTSAVAYTEQFTGPNTVHSYRVIRLWEQDSAPLLTNPGLLPLATLARTEFPQALLEQVASQIDMIEEPEQRRNISACAEVLASLRFEKDFIRQFFREDLMREAPLYQDILQEGREKGLQQGLQQGKREEALEYTTRLLTRRIGPVAPELQAQIQELSLTQLEDLGEALLDFFGAADLTAWLQVH